jgi:hypothetical protein
LPRAVYLESDPWTCENRLLTPSFKISRLVMRNHYRNLLHQVTSIVLLFLLLLLLFFFFVVVVVVVVVVVDVDYVTDF